MLGNREPLDSDLTFEEHGISTDHEEDGMLTGDSGWETARAWQASGETEKEGSKTGWANSGRKRVTFEATAVVQIAISVETSHRFSQMLFPRYRWARTIGTAVMLLVFLESFTAAAWGLGTVIISTSQMRELKDLAQGYKLAGAGCSDCRGPVLSSKGC